MGEKANSIWAVTAGEYSDYGVLAVFESEDDARDAKDSGFGDDYTELPLYRDGRMPIRRDYVGLGVPLDAATGEIINEEWIDGAMRTVPLELSRVRVDRHVDWYHPSDVVPSRSQARVSYVDWRRHPCWHVYVEAEDEAMARKVFYDLVAKTRAEIIEGVRCPE